MADLDLHEEAVELGFRQGIGAFLLQRVLGRQHVEGRGQIVRRAGDRDLVLLHRLQQRRLGPRAGAVDLVGHQKLAEHRPRDEAEGPLPALALFQHLGAEDVSRHQVGRALHPLVLEAQDRAEGLDQAGLGQAGHADQQGVAAGQERD